MTHVSPLELLLAAGRARTLLLLGGAAAEGLAPADAAAARSDADLALVVPSRRELRRGLPRLVAQAAAGIAGDGMVYVVVPPAHARRVASLLERNGLGPGPLLAHVTDRRRLRYLVPLAPGPWRFAFGVLITARPRLRAVLRRLPMPVARRAVRRIGVTGTPAGVRPGAWTGTPGPLLVAGARRGDGGSCTAWCFAGGDEPRPAAVAKLGPGAALEARNLDRLRAGAAAAGARVPSVLSAGGSDGAASVVESVLPGVPAAHVLGRAPERLVPLAEAVARWLAEWGRGSASRGTLDADLLTRRVLAPADELLAAGLPDRVVHRLRESCERLSGREATLVAVHNDLTMWNVLVDPGGGIGVVDWETAEPAGLPLADLYYALVDAVAATTRGGRPAAAEACFAPGGRCAELVGRLSREVAEAVAADDDVAELAYHACWLGHARNELRRPGSSGEFLRIAAAGWR